MGSPASGRSLRSLQEFGRSALAATALGAPRFAGTGLARRCRRLISRRRAAGGHDVVGIFPYNASLLRLATMLAIEQNDCAGRPPLPEAGSIALVLEDQGDRPTDLEEVRQLQAA